jgi:hypothetical protein
MYTEAVAFQTTLDAFLKFALKSFSIIAGGFSPTPTIDTAITVQITRIANTTSVILLGLFDQAKDAKFPLNSEELLKFYDLVHILTRACAVNRQKNFCKDIP